jgi:hypothetical protein
MISITPTVYFLVLFSKRINFLSNLSHVNLQAVTRLIKKYYLFNGHQPIKCFPAVTPVPVRNMVSGNIDVLKINCGLLYDTTQYIIIHS